MFRLMTLVALATSGAAIAQQPAPPTAAPSSPDVTVRAPERMVCRQVTRTATRMRSSRVCRPVSQMRAEEQQNQDEVLAEAADTLDVLGERVGTGDLGGMGSDMDTPLGPR